MSQTSQATKRRRVDGKRRRVNLTYDSEADRCTRRWNMKHTLREFPKGRLPLRTISWTFLPVATSRRVKATMRDRFSPRLVNPNVALGRAGEKSSAISSSVTIRMTCMYRWSTWLDTYRIFIRLRRAVRSLIIYNYGAHIYKHTFQNPSWLHFGLPGYRITHVTLMHVPTQICTFEGMCYY